MGSPGPTISPGRTSTDDVVPDETASSHATFIGPYASGCSARSTSSAIGSCSGPMAGDESSE